MPLHADTAGRPATAAVYNAAAGAVQLRRISGSGTVTTWAEVTGVATGPAMRLLKLTYLDGVYQITMDGAVVLTYTVPDAATRSAVELNRAIGVVALNDFSTTFDNLQGYPR